MARAPSRSVHICCAPFLTWRPFRRAARAGRDRQGAAVVEMALVAPFVLMLVFGLVEFARMVMVKQALTNAAREGCRTAVLATTTDPQTIDSCVRQYLKGSIASYSSASVVRVSTTPTDVSGVQSGTTVTTYVEVDCSDVSWMPIFVLVDLTLTGSSTMKRE